MTEHDPRHRERLSEEIAFHIEQQTQKLIRAGMPPDQARNAECGGDLEKRADIHGANRPLKARDSGLLSARFFSQLTLRPAATLAQVVDLESDIVRDAVCHIGVAIFPVRKTPPERLNLPSSL